MENTRKKSMTKVSKTPAKPLSAEVALFCEEIQELYRPWNIVWTSFLRGVAFGFGTIIGATVVVAFFVFLLSKISFVPLLGNFIDEVIREIENTEAKNPI